ncbi:MAG: type IV pilus assembly protein PilM [Patescibacteria group bacterium]
MFSFLKSIFGFGSVLGVDIGTASIKAVEIAKSSPKPRLKNYGVLHTYGHLDRLNSAIQTNSLKISENDTAELLKKFIKKAKFNSRNAIASIPAFSAFITLIEMPIMSEAEINKSMAFQVKQHIPLPISDVAIEWVKIGERDEGGALKQQILFISIPKEIISRYQNIFKMAGLNLMALEVEGVSLVRALAVEPKTTVIADIGAYSTNIIVTENYFLKSETITDFSGVSLTQAIANGLQISPKRAEELKKMKGLKATGGEYELSTLPQPYLDVIIKEIIREKDNYEKNYNNKVERILLSGGSANLIGIEEYFEKQLNAPVDIGNPLARLSYPSEINLLARELGPELAVAIGLGIKNFV